MESFHTYAGSRKLVPSASFYYAPSTSVGPVVTRLVVGIQFKQAASHTKFRISAIKKCSAFSTACSSLKGHYCGTSQLLINELSSKVHCQLNKQSSPEQVESVNISRNTNEEYQVHDLDKEADYASSAKSTIYIHDREMQRRRKIGLANKGRKPWNKGRKHSEETRERISKRTIEALNDPKVRKKMSEYPHSHSDQSKARISSALRKMWQERLRKKKLQENCYFTWARSIAETAKKGFPGQEELEWDSYERMKSDIISQHLQRRADRARAKEIAKLRAEQAAKIRAENAARRAQLWKEKEEKAKARELKALARKKSEDMKMKMALSKGLKLKARLTKFKHHKRNLESSASIQRENVVESQAVVDNLDIDLVKIEKMRRISLADQLQAVKNKKGSFHSNNFLATAFPISSSEVEAGDS